MHPKPTKENVRNAQARSVVAGDNLGGLGALADMQRHRRRAHLAAGVRHRIRPGPPPFAAQYIQLNHEENRNRTRVARVLDGR
jgi:hypothetical protein